MTRRGPGAQVWQRLPHEKKMAFLHLMTSPLVYDRVCDVVMDGREGM